MLNFQNVGVVIVARAQGLRREGQDASLPILAEGGNIPPIVKWYFLLFLLRFIFDVNWVI